MRRLSNLYEKIYSLENLELADRIARKGKRKQYGVRLHDRSRHTNLVALQRMLKDKTYRTSDYSIFKIFEPKEREVYRLPYFPDRIAHHAIMNVLKPIFVSVFTANSYSCIENRGIHAGLRAIKKALLNRPETEYCLKLDITKFYPSVDHEILKQLLRKKIKDQDLLWLLDGIIDSAPGLPIGNYLSQYLANFYLTYFDHYVKEILRVKSYFRYADDIVILASSKQELHQLLSELKTYLTVNLKLSVKKNHRVFPVRTGIDYLGYVLTHDKVRLRKGIKKNFCRAVAKNNLKAIPSYLGWAKHCNSRNLIKKLKAA